MTRDFWMSLLCMVVVLPAMFWLTRRQNRWWEKQRVIQAELDGKFQAAMKSYIEAMAPRDRVSLDEADFRILVNGGILKKGSVEISLKDIGFDRMGGILRRAWEGAPKE